MLSVFLGGFVTLKSFWDCFVTHFCLMVVVVQRLITFLVLSAEVFRTHRLTFYAIQLTSRSSLILENLISDHPVMKFLASNGIRRFINDRKRPPLYPLLIYVNTVHTLSLYFPMNHFNIILTSTFASSEWSLSFRILNQKCWRFSHLFSACYTPPYLILLQLFVLIPFVK